MAVGSAESGGQETPAENLPAPDGADGADAGRVPDDDTSGGAGETSSAAESYYRTLSAGIEPSSTLGRYLRWYKAKLAEKYIQHDHAAVRYKRLYDGVVKFVYSASAAAVGVVIVQTSFLGDKYQIVWLEVALIVAMFAVQRGGRRLGFREHWLQNRFLAEKLRCSVYTLLWQRAPHRGGSVEYEALAGASKRGEAWAAELAGVPPFAGPHWQAARDLVALKQFVAETWLVPQRQYHNAAARKHHRAFERIELLGNSLLALTFCAAVLHARHLGHEFPIGPLLIIIAVLLPAVSASLSGIKHATEMHKMAVRSRHTARRIEAFEAELQAVDTLEQLAVLVERIESYFMLEHEEWHALMELKEPDVG